MPLPPSFVVKNGSKIRAAVSAVHAGSGVADRHLDVVAGLQPRMSGHADPVELDVAQLDHDFAAVRHRIARVDDEVHEDLLDLRAVGEHGREVGPELR